MIPQEYRLKHRSCKWCEYKKFNYYGYECSIKNKRIPKSDGLSKGRGMFCKVYKPEELNL